MADTTKPRRRFLRFSLRTLLILMPMVAVPLGLLGRTVAMDRRQRASLVALEDAGCSLACADSPVRADENLLSLLAIRLGLVDNDPPQTVVGISGNYSRLSDADLVHLQGMCQLADLDLYGTAVTDAGLAQLRGSTQLRTLSIGATKITDAGLANLADLKRLNHLIVE